MHIRAMNLVVVGHGFSVIEKLTGTPIRLVKELVVCYVSNCPDDHIVVAGEAELHSRDGRGP